MNDPESWTDVLDVIRSMSALADGWDGDGAVAPSSVAIGGATGAARSMCSAGFPPPARVVATPNGAVSMEWYGRDGGYCEMDFEDAGCGQFYSVSPGGTS